MKRIDLLIQLLTNIYELLKLHLGAPCNCLAADKKKHVDHEERSIVQILKSIDQQVHLSNELAADHHNAKDEACQSKELEEWISKQEVLDYLQISDRTYRRQVESGLLKPMNIGGGDFYFKSQLVKALHESRRRGRV